MKTFIEFLAEMPYHTQGTYNPKVEMELLYSKRTLDRDFDVISSFSTVRGEFIYAKRKITTSGTTYVVLVPGGDKFKLICFVKFKIHPTIDVKNFKNPIQVDSAKMDDEYQGAGIVTALYALIVKSGHTVISDATQFTPGKELWKKIARESAKLGLKVYVVDGDRHQTYDGENIDDKFIWSTDIDYSKYDVLLIAK
jgi:hypothetical protein